MSKLKDKLSASVRQAKATQQPARQQAVAAKPAPAAAKPVAQSAKPQQAEKPAAASSSQIPASGTALFPQRVWPD